jgi:N utilization substance protein A
MAEITFTEETIQYVRLFQDITRSTVIDCMETPDRLLFVVKTGDIAKAIGKGGENVQALRSKMKKDIHVVEYSEDPKQFVANVFRNYDVKKVDVETRENGVVHATVTVDPLRKGRAIGKEGRNLRVFRDLIVRHHAIQSVSVA